MISTALIVSMFFFSCSEEEETLVQEGSVKFSFEKVTKSLKSISSKATLKSSLNDPADAEKIIISVADAQGNEVKSSEELALYNMNGEFISETISLLVGNYTLTEFLVLDASDDVIFASPVEGSDKAYLVEGPLPVSFSVSKDEVEKVVPEVLDTEESVPEDFGYSSFSFEVTETFDFLVSLMVYNPDVSNFELSTGTITVSSGGEELYHGGLEAVTNKITVNDGYENYVLIVEKPLYFTYKDTLTNEELKSHFSSEDNGPLMIRLEQSTYILQPGPEEGKDALLRKQESDTKTDYGNYALFGAHAWTNSGVDVTWRSLIDFDLEDLPKEKEINKAILYLYSDPVFDSTAGQESYLNWCRGHSTLSGSNAAWLERVTAPWGEDMVTWYNQPSTTQENRVPVPASTSEYQDYEIDVTALVKDILGNPETSHGFLFKLQNETYYRSMKFGSSDNVNPSLWPKLVVEY